MRYVTHQFAHLDTLERARRWLVQLGFDPGHIETHTDGIPRIALSVEADRAAEAEMVINAAELTDPNPWPSFWDLARQEHVYPAAAVSHATTEHHAQTMPIGWHPAEEKATEAIELTEVWDVTTQFE